MINTKEHIKEIEGNLKSGTDLEATMLNGELEFEQEWSDKAKTKLSFVMINTFQYGLIAESSSCCTTKYSVILDITKKD